MWRVKDARGFADDFKTADDGVLRPLDGEELFAVHPGEVLLDDARRIENIGEIRAILRHKSAARSKEWRRADKDCGCVRWPNG